MSALTSLHADLLHYAMQRRPGETWELVEVSYR
jgi:hypothetical protein